MSKKPIQKIIKDKDLILGTAMWGWTIEKKECFRMLDFFYDKGFKAVDIAPNYPINNNHNYFRYAENILLEWININNICDLEIISKIGSYDNSGNPKNNLSFSFILMNYQYYIEKFGKNLKNLMVHWDNRNSASAIELTIKALEFIKAKGINIGLAGIKNPKLYFESQSQAILNCTFELKHNIFSTTIKNYSMFKKTARFLVYGVNASGLKINQVYHSKNNIIVRKKDQESKRYGKTINKIDKFLIKKSKYPLRKITNFNHIGMIYAYNTSWVDGIIIGPSSIVKLEDTILFFKKLVNNDSTHIYENIKALCYK